LYIYTYLMLFLDIENKRNNIAMEFFSRLSKVGNFRYVLPLLRTLCSIVSLISSSFLYSAVVFATCDATEQIHRYYREIYAALKCAYIHGTHPYPLPREKYVGVLASYTPSKMAFLLPDAHSYSKSAHARGRR